MTRYHTIVRRDDGRPGVRGDSRPGRNRVSQRGRTLQRRVLTFVAVLAAGCGTVGDRPSAQIDPPVIPSPSPWPGAAEYVTIKTALAVRNDALFHETDWRKRSFAADLALRTLMTVRIAAGPCAIYVAELYGNLRDLADAYPSENWRPLVRLVHGQPRLASACRPPDPTAI